MEPEAPWSRAGSNTLVTLKDTLEIENWDFLQLKGHLLFETIYLVNLFQEIHHLNVGE